MKLLYVADGRSPIARNWMAYFLENGHAVHLASTFPCQPDERLASYTFIQVAFSQAKAGSRGQHSGGIWSAQMVGLRTWLRQALGALTLPKAARQLTGLIAQIRPDLVHAMRIPFEGMLAAHALSAAPRLVSVWGNDFTLHAAANPWMGALTRRTLRYAAALHSDCRRDLRLAYDWGFPAGRPALTLPGAGGLQLDVFYPAAPPVQAPVVIQPRGVRAYVDNAVFFQAAAVVRRQRPEVRFLCPNMAGEAQVRRQLADLGLEAAVELLPPMPHLRMAELFRQARVVVSPTHHDGTPNSLLEGMACGCVPVAGELESLREWITPGENGLLAVLDGPDDLAKAMLRALEDDELQSRARQINTRLVHARADYPTVMAQAAEFYQRLVS